jgi:uncharacterized protein YdaU (DUF1376 family)
MGGRKVSEESKRRAPAFQFYADDFLAGTMTMTNEERGAYISLLCLQWSKGFVTELDIQRMCLGMPTHCQSICQSKFEAGDDGHYRNKRLEKERLKQKERSEKQRDIANLRWKNHANALPEDMPDDAKAYAESVPEVCFPSPSPSPTPVKEKSIAPKSQRSRFVPPTVEDVEAGCVKIGLPISEAGRFIDYYESKGWKVSGSLMKSWPASLRNWKRNRDERQQSLPMEAPRKKELDWRDSL